MRRGGARRPALAGLFLAVAAAGAGCGGEPVALRYKFADDTVTRYRWTVSGTTVSRSQDGDSITHRLRLVMAVTETVTEVGPEGTAKMRVALAPVEVVEDGRKGVPGPPVDIELEVTPTGQVRKVTGAASLPPEILSALELERLLSESRPPLPTRRVEVGDTWKAPLTSKGENSSIDLEGTGTLARFEFPQRERAARVSIERKGTVKSRQEIPEGQALLDGTSRVESVALIGVESGQLMQADSTVKSRFKLSIGEDTAPGTLTVELNTSVRRAGPGGKEKR